MKTNIITPEHKTAVQIFLAIFALTAIMFFSSCQSARHQERSGCFASKRMSGYGPGGYSYRTHANSRKAF